MKPFSCRFACFLPAIFLVLSIISTSYAVEIGFDEEFSLADDRSVPLKQLIPGTEDYYYYSCLYHQQRGENAQVEQLLKQWVNRYSHTARSEEIQTRQILLDYAKNPEKVVEFVIARLGLRFDHAKKQTVSKQAFPCKLDQNWLSFDNLKKLAMRDYGDLSGFKYPGLELLVGEKLDNDRRRDLLTRLRYPDADNIAQMVTDDLQYRYSGGFGSLPIHNKLLLKHLDYCKEKMPQLLNENNFVTAYLKKLQPGADEKWENAPQTRLALLVKMHNFVATLAPVFNSLKAHLLYHILDVKRTLGKYDRAMFLDYLKLPRNVFYLNRKYFESNERQVYRADLNANFKDATLCEPVCNDEPLVRDYLQNLMLADQNSTAFSGYIDSDYLKQLFAETMIVNAVGDMENWFSLLDAHRVKELKERTELEFLPTNKTLLLPEEPTRLTVKIKNIKKLIVKIYKLNLPNYYRENSNEVSTAIDLDGLVANEELVFEYSHPSYQRHTETFDLKNITGRGVYIAELIGNGMSSRAMIRRGQLSFVQRSGAAGHLFSVFNEARQQIKDAAILFGGNEYKADATGLINVPYTSTPGNRQFVIKHGDFAALHNFNHQAEAYSFEAGIYTDREALIEGKTATLVVRPSLALNSFPVSVNLLKNVRLLITSIDRENVASTREITDFKLFNDRETTFEFKVPEKLSRITFAIRGKVENLSMGREDELSADRSIDINGIESTEKTLAFFIRKDNGNYLVELLGKSGEPCPDRPVNIQIRHRLIKPIIPGTLQTDEKGRLYLGNLEGVESVSLSGPESITMEFLPSVDRNTLSDTMCVSKGQNILIPLTGNADKKIEELCSLYDIRANSFVEDFRKNVIADQGFYQIKDLPAGDYEMYLKETQQSIKIKVADGRQIDCYTVSERRALPILQSSPLHITKAKIQNGKLLINLANAKTSTRAHVIAGRFLPEFLLFNEFAKIQAPYLPEITLASPLSHYLSGRNIGDEYRYILERRYAKIFPGNMLKKPGLLLNPWSLRKTDTSTQEAAAGGAWSGLPEPSPQTAASAGHIKRKELAETRSSAFANLDFLAGQSIVLTNLRPDKNGNIEIDAGNLNACHNLQIIAIDGFDVAYRELSLPEVTEKHQDLRLARALEPDKHFSQQKNISILAKNESLVIEDISTARVEIYDSLPSAYRLLATLNPNSDFAQFAFITGWADLKEPEKLELYSKHACHELNFFVYQRDREFFTQVIKPFIADKRDKTFMDKWLLNMDLQEYFEPWAFSRLNIVEKILLGQKLPDRAATIARHIEECFDLLPDDREKYNRLFKTALLGNALATGDTLGFAAGKKDYSKGLRRAGEEMLFDKDMEIPSPADYGAPRGAPPMPLSAAAPAKEMAKSKMQIDSKNEVAFDDEFREADFEQSMELEADAGRRNAVRQIFRQVDKTEEWVENNYYHLPIEQQIADLIKVNAFWKDYATHRSGRPFISENFAQAAGNFSEMMLALAVLELPFKADKHESKFDGAKMTIKAGGNAIIFHEEIKPAGEIAETTSILTGQNFFAQSDRYRYEKNERFDKFVTEEFLTRVVYGCQIVLTNPTSSRQKIDVLMQIPRGAIPVLQSHYTKSIHMQLEPFSTATTEYFFYFPSAGNWSHYPVHVSENEKMLATTRPFVFKVVNELTNFDKTSWPWVSQNSSDNDVLEYLMQNNLERLDLSQIAFRMKNRDFFINTYELLKRRHVYNNILWSYGLYHRHLQSMREYLSYSPLATQAGSNIKSELLDVNPIERHTYQHKEYWPLVNARVYPLGKKREILNAQFAGQYQALMADLRYRSPLSDYDFLAVVYYLLLQDRIEEAMLVFKKIADPELIKTIQYQYMKAFLAFSHQQIEEAVKIAACYKDYPVERWKLIFADILAQAAEISGGSTSATDIEDRDQKQRLLAATQPDIELEVNNRTVTLRQRNLQKAQINYYLMDIELMFSRQPFVQQVTGQFSIISPNHTIEIELASQASEIKLELPEKYRDSNMMIEVVSGGLTRTAAYYPHSLAISLIESYGQLHITHQKTKKPVVSAYIKVYARDSNGNVSFYKDGYTDMRGKFDYASISTSQLENVEKFAILIMTDDSGSVIREATPPGK